MTLQVVATQVLPNGHTIVYFANVEADEPVVLGELSPEAMEERVVTAKESGKESDPAVLADALVALQEHHARLSLAIAAKEEQHAQLDVALAARARSLDLSQATDGKLETPIT